MSNCEETFKNYGHKLCTALKNIYKNGCDICSQAVNSKNDYKDQTDLELGFKTIPEEDYYSMKTKISKLETQIIELKLELIKQEKSKIKSNFKTKRKNKQTTYNKNTQTSIINELSYTLKKRHSLRDRSSSLNEIPSNNIQLTVSVKDNNTQSTQTQPTKTQSTQTQSTQTQQTESKPDDENNTQQGDTTQEDMSSQEDTSSQELSSQEDTSSQELSSWDEISTKEDLNDLI